MQNVFITSSGAWKLGGFGFAISTDQASGNMANVQEFHYAVSKVLIGIVNKLSSKIILIHHPSLTIL